MKLPTTQNDERALWALALAAFVAETGSDESNASNFSSASCSGATAQARASRLTSSAPDLCTAKRRTQPQCGAPKMRAERQRWVTR